jgi:hypothetical protein
MYKQVFTPTEKNNTVTIPREWYGKEIEVIAFPISEEAKLQTKATDVEDIKRIFKPYLVSLEGFKFNRDEANNYD